MSPLHHVAPPCFYSSPKWTNPTLALERASQVYSRQRSRGWNEGWSTGLICKLHVRYHQILHTWSLKQPDKEKLMFPHSAVTVLSVCLSVWLSVCLSVCLTVCLSVCLTVWLSVCLFSSCSGESWGWAQSEEGEISAGWWRWWRQWGRRGWKSWGGTTRVAIYICILQRKEIFLYTLF